MLRKITTAVAGMKQIKGIRQKKKDQSEAKDPVIIK